MDSIFLNYKDVQFILGCSTADAKVEIYKHLPWDQKSDLQDLSNMSKSKKSNFKSPYEFVKTIHEVDINSFTIKLNSFSEELHDRLKIQYTVSKMRESGISDTMKHEVLEDVTNIIRSSLCGKWVSLKKLLTESQVKQLEDSLKVRRALYIGSGNKIPKKLTKYVKEEEFA